MKTKFMMLLAAMLLSASAFAQSENNEPLKGDVNGDGKVDVADINEIIKIMKEAGGTAETPTYYWYVGKDESKVGKSGMSYNLDLSKLPTVTSINDIYSNSQYVGSVENNIYIVCPTSWVGQFNLLDLDDNELIFIDKTDQITSGVTGYSILRGAAPTFDEYIKIVHN